MSAASRVGAAESFAHKARAAYPDQVQRVVLFGSVARGEDRASSDVDVLVVWRGDHGEGIAALTRLAFDLLLETEEYVSVKVLTPEELEAGRRSHNPFVEAVLAEGQAIG